MKKTIKTKGFLLKKTWLANDDAVLDIFTADLGRVTVFAGKLARSKKRQLELDFFRLLDLELEQGKSSYRLKSVSTKLWFGALQANYELSKQSFLVLENLRRTLPEEKPLLDFFNLSCEILNSILEDRAVLLLTFWEVKALLAAGVCPRFDIVRSDMWWEFESFEIYPEYIANGVAVKNEVRQMLELLRRSDLETVLEKAEGLPAETTSEAFVVLQQMAEYH